MTRILLDANILISYLLNPHADRPITQVVQAGGLGTHTLLLPEASLEEMSTKIAEKRYLKERIDQADADQLFAVLWRVGETIAAIDDPIPAVTRDPKDDYLLAYAVIGLVDYLLTVDEDLLVQNGRCKASRSATQASLLATAAYPTAAVEAALTSLYVLRRHPEYGRPVGF